MGETRFKQTHFRAQILKIEYHCPTCWASFQNPQPSLAENKLLSHCTPHRTAPARAGNCKTLMEEHVRRALSLCQTSLIFIILGRAGGGERRSVCAHICSGYKSFLWSIDLKCDAMFLI